jgi:hypothetical protein
MNIPAFSVSLSVLNDRIMYKNSMPKDFKNKWLEALRSGEYKQGFRRLYNREADCYCVMGVLASVGGLGHEAIVNKGTVPIDFLSDQGVSFPYRNGCPILMYNDRNLPLDCINDQFLLSFNELADLIESQVEGV